MTGRHIVLTEDGLTVSPSAYHRLMAVCFFPESPRDQAQALHVAEMERAEFLKVSQANYKPSEIAQSIANLIEKRSAQQFSVGLVALSFLWLKHHAQGPSLNRASTLAGYCANCFGSISWRSGLDPTGEDKTKPVTGDPKSVAQLFRKYQGVAHICASRVASGSYLDHLHVWDQPADVVGALIQSCAAYQGALEEVPGSAQWNMWDVRRFFPASLYSAPVLLPDQELLTWMALGFDTAVSDGVITRKP